MMLHQKPTTVHTHDDTSHYGNNNSAPPRRRKQDSNVHIPAQRLLPDGSVADFGNSHKKNQPDRPLPKSKNRSKRKSPEPSGEVSNDLLTLLSGKEDSPVPQNKGKKSPVTVNDITNDLKKLLYDSPTLPDGAKPDFNSEVKNRSKLYDKSAKPKSKKENKPKKGPKEVVVNFENSQPTKAYAGSTFGQSAPSAGTLPKPSFL